MKKRLWELVVVVLTALSLLAVVRGLRFSPDVSALLPEAGEGAALRKYVRGFGGGDLALLLVRGEDPEQVRLGAEAAARAVAACSQVRATLDKIEIAASAEADPTLAWAHAGPRAQQALRDALTPEGMDARLADTRALLLSPGAAALRSALQRDPLRLSQIPTEQGVKVGEGASTSSPGGFGGSGALSTQDGKARLVLMVPRGSALRAAEAKRFVGEIQQALAPVRSSFQTVRFDLAGGHAFAVATEQMIRSDLILSGTVSMVLAALAFAITFRRVRALVAVLPPLMLGTLWTAAVAGTVFGQISGIAVAFVSVVVGVGVDTGVHVYSALLAARAEGLGPVEAAQRARRTMARPTLIAALAAAAAFGSLALSRIAALRQFGLLCAAGEFLTAVAILLVTPTLGAWLERGPVPVRSTEGFPRWLRTMVESRSAPWLAAATALIPLVLLGVLGAPTFARAVVTLRPERLELAQIQQEIFDKFGGDLGQWVVLVEDAEPEAARARSDAIAEKLAEIPEAVASLSSLSDLAASRTTQARRLKQRDALDLPAKADQLRAALERAGFAADRFESAYQALRTPSSSTSDWLEQERPEATLLRVRYLAQEQGRTLAALYVIPRAGQEQRVEDAVRAVDPGAALTGYSRLDRALRANLSHDLPWIGAAALVLVALVLAGSLRGLRDVVLVCATLVFELAWVLALVRLAGLRIHAYNALVLPVLIGVTIDEALFLLHRARGKTPGEALQQEARNVSATALTTAAGFGALVFCRFEGLVDLGVLGALGVLAGLVAALIAVPVGLRLWPERITR